MNWTNFNSRSSLIAVIVIAALFASPADASAQWLGYRNDTTAPVLVQGYSIINRTPRQGKRHILQPGQETWDSVAAPGNKLIVVADAKQPTRTLGQATVPFVGKDMFFSIQPIPPAVKEKLQNAQQSRALLAQPQPEVQLTPAKATTMPPPGGGPGIPIRRP